MVDEPKTDGNADTVTAPEPSTVQAQTQGTSESVSGVDSRIHGLTAEKGRLAKKIESLEAENAKLKQQSLTEQEMAVEKAKQEAIEPYKQRVQNIEATLVARLDEKLATMEPEQRALVPEALPIEERLAQADRVLTSMGKQPTSIGGAINPQNEGPKTYTREQFESWQRLAGSPLAKDKAKWREDRDEMKAAYREGRVLGFKKE